MKAIFTGRNKSQHLHDLSSFFNQEELNDVLAVAHLNESSFNDKPFISTLYNEYNTLFLITHCITVWNLNNIRYFNFVMLTYNKEQGLGYIVALAKLLLE